MSLKNVEGFNCEYCCHWMTDGQGLFGVCDRWYEEVKIISRPEYKVETEEDDLIRRLRTCAKDSCRTWEHRNVNEE